MEEHPPLFNYLGEDMMQQHLLNFTHQIQSCFDPSSLQYQKLATFSDKVVRKKEKWPEKIYQSWQNRKVPVYSPETITKVNQARVSQIDFANDNRKRLRSSLEADISRVKRKLDDVHKRRDQCEEKYNETNLSSTAQINLLPSRDVHERIRLSTALRSAYDTYIWTIRRLATQEGSLIDEQNALQNELAPIKMISNQSNQKHLVQTKGNSLIGWLPGEETYVLLQQSKSPPPVEIFRHISYEPQTGLTNLPLSIYNLISYADEIGATDAVLLQMLTVYLKEHRPNILDVIDIKKRSIAAIMEILSHHCSTESEKATITLQLKHFKRDSIESFASAVFRFESLYVFWLQLDSPHTADSIKLLSYDVLRQITQYLLSPKAGQAFGKWASDTLKNGGTIDKEAIIRTVAQLESYAELKLHSPRTIPGSLITTTLGLPIESSEQTIVAHYVNPQQPMNLKQQSSAKTNQNPSSTRAKSNNSASNSRPRSSNSNSKSRNPSAENAKRRQSQSPGNKVNNTRGRSSEKSKTISAKSADTLDEQMDCLQYYSRHSTSPNIVRKQSIPGIFKRTLTPNSKEHLKQTYFYATSGDNKFSDVRKKGYCLRCYGSNHLANSCKVYTSPTPTPCRHCMHLFHDTKKCRFFDQSGKSRPPSRSKSPYTKEK